MNQVIAQYLPLLSEDHTLELYTNKLHDAVLVIIYPSGLEKHVDVDLSGITIGEMVELEYLGVDMCGEDDHSEPHSERSTNQNPAYADTNFPDEIVNEK